MARLGDLDLGSWLTSGDTLPFDATLSASSRAGDNAG